MANEITDDVILKGLRMKNESITKQYFYGYCRMAYHIFDRRYGLEFKSGMDFFSLAHEYYIALDRKDWKPLEDRSPDVSLKDWMIGGFRFLVLDKLKGSDREFASDDVALRADNNRLQFDLPDSGFSADVRRTVEELCDSCFGRDHKKAILLKMILVEGYKGKEVAEQLGMTPSAVTQQYHKLMETVVIPYFKRYFTAVEEPSYNAMPDMDMDHGQPKILFRMGDYRTGAGHRMKDLLIKNMKERITPEFIQKLQPDEVFVFGSNLAGMHGGGAARIARMFFGAKMGQGVGLQGSSYAIPTMQGGTETIAPYVNEFIRFAKAHPEKRFLVTRIGCGIAGFEPEDIAPLFREAVSVSNVTLPADFWKILI